MNCAHCQSSLGPDQPNCPRCGKVHRPRRKRRNEVESEVLSAEAQLILERAKQEYHRALWGLIPGAGLFLGPWVCWSARRLQANPEAKPSLPFLRSIFRIALLIAASQWLGFVLLLLSLWIN